MSESWKQTLFVCVYLTALILLVAMEQRQYFFARLAALPQDGGTRSALRQDGWSLSQHPSSQAAQASYDTSSMAFPAGTFDGSLDESPMLAMLVEIAVEHGHDAADVPSVRALTEELIERRLIPPKGALMNLRTPEDAEQLSLEEKRRLGALLAGYLASAADGSHGTTAAP